MNTEQTICLMKQMDKSTIIQSYIKLSQEYEEFVSNQKKLIKIKQDKIDELEKRISELTKLLLQGKQ